MNILKAKSLDDHPIKTAVMGFLGLLFPFLQKPTLMITNGLGIRQYWDEAYRVLDRYHKLALRPLGVMGVGDLVVVIGKYSSPKLTHVGLTLVVIGAIAIVINFLQLKRMLDSLNQRVIVHVDGVAPKRLHFYL